LKRQNTEKNPESRREEIEQKITKVAKKKREEMQKS